MSLKRCAVLALAIVSTAVAQGAPSAAPGRDFDAGWTAYFGPDHFLYLAVKNPNIDGPLMHRPLDQEPIGPVKQGSPASFFRSFIDDAKKEKIIDAHLTELMPEGFAAGVSPATQPKAEPSVLMVAPKTAQLTKFVEWVVGKYKAKHGADAVAELKVEGQAGFKFLKTDKSQPVIVIAEGAVLMSNTEEAITAALKRAKDPKETVATAKYYKRGRSRVSADAAMFVMIDPMPMLNLIEQSSTGPQGPDQAKKVADAKRNFQAVDSVLVQVSAGKEASHFDLSVLLDPASPAYKNFKLLAGAAGVKASGLAGVDTPAFLSIIRPTDLAGGVAPESRDQLTQQLTSMKGMLQVQTGLEFDRDVAPWWGNEIALLLHVPDGGTPEGALLFESKDAKAAGEAVDKVVRHVGVSQNRKFNDQKVGDVTLKVAAPPEGAPASPVNPTLGIAQNYVVLATGPNVITNALEAKTKLSAAPGYTRLSSAIPAAKQLIVIYLKTDVLVKAQGPNANAPTGPGAQIKKLADEVESIAVGLGWPDEESVRLTVLFSGR